MKKKFVRFALLSRNRSHLMLIPGMGLGVLVFLLLIISGLFINAAYASARADNGKVQAKQGNLNTQTGQNVCKPGKGDNPDPNNPGKSLKKKGQQNGEPLKKKDQQNTDEVSVLGTITSINGDTLIIQDWDATKKNGGQPVTITIQTTSSTEVISKVAGRKISVGELKVGNFIQVTGKSDNSTFTATNIVVGNPPPADQCK